ncbi:hypothetical protein SLEP1_g21816 [Rubroshorea leprosula]|uniref:Uncharacterized protein n=2 Tax=Rubroshorea leprosula TaxID=152421 RepID=A0AAV5JG27_9ROSI|nr:hypothetical protein SLEP1_g21816 [Rubroshorea leprosula]
MEMDKEVNIEEESASASHLPGVLSQNPAANTENQQDSDKSQKKGEKTVPFYKLFSFADPLDYLLMFIGTIGAAANGVCMPLINLSFGNLVNAFGQNADIKEVVHDVSKVSLDFVYLALGSCVASFLQITCWIITGERQAARIRTLYLKTILRQDIGFFDKDIQTGEIIGRMSGDTVLIQDAMGEKVGKFIQLIAGFLGGFIVAFVNGWLLTLVLISSIPPLVFAGAVMSIIIAKLASHGQTSYSVAANVVEQTIGSIRTVASFTGEKQAIASYDKSLMKAYKAGVQEGWVSGIGIGVVSFIAFSTYALAVWFGGKMVVEKGYTGGDVMNIMFCIFIGSIFLGQASLYMTAFAAGQAAAFKMFEAIERKPDIDAYDTNGRKLDDIQGDIEFKDVYFSYPARPDEQIFSGFSLSILKGTTAALVGESGSGKSTVISLIERFYDPQAGEVLIDGINIKEFQLRWIRQKIGLVSQEPILFASSIRDNIAYGKDGATDEEIKAAAELANAAKFIDKLPQGLDTQVGKHGTQLSGGQKQRVAIARAILKDPRILLLDEATSALDAESEKIVQEALDRVMINRTTMIVAHRLSTIRNADMISVIQKGKIVEKGTHSELIKDLDGAYCQLIRLQEISMASEQIVLNDSERPEIVIESGRYLSERTSGVGNSSRHSFSLPFGLPTRISVQEREPPEPCKPASRASKPPPEVSLRRLAYLNKPEFPAVLLGSIAAAVNGVVFPMLGFLLSGALKSFNEPAHLLRKDANFWALMYLFLSLTCLLVNPLKSYFFAVAGCKLIRRIRLLCFEKVVHMEVSWFDEAEHTSGAIGARLSADTASIRNLVGDALGLLFQNIASAIAALVIAFKSSWKLSLIMLVMIPMIGLNGYVQMLFIKGFSADAKKIFEGATQVASDAVGSIRTIASFCAEDKVMELYQKKCAGPMKNAMKQGLVGGLGFGASFLLLYCAYALSFYAGARLLQAGEITYSEVFRVFFSLITAIYGISQSGSFVPDAGKTSSAAASVFAILDRKSKINSSDNSGEIIEKLKGEIEIKNVSFKYPTRPDIQIFRDLCLTIHSGKTVALVGESGSGKSTVISLLQRFYDPDSGQITLDGVEIQKLQLNWLRQQMGLVSQEPVLFNDTIKANIAYGKEGNATETEIIAAAELANAHKFISSLQQGYDTLAGERGIQLSGGQKQRVAIARAIMKAPKILLLDEATSALDVESEKLVQGALDRVMVDKTTVVVAHRLSTIKGANFIAVVKNGVIAEKGKHEALMNKKDGIYASLVALHTTASSQ